MDDLYEDSLKLRDMIDSDIRSLRQEDDDYYIESYSSHLDFNSHMNPLESTLDSDLSVDIKTGWLDASFLNGSSDFDSAGALMVNPRTGLPVSMSDSSCSSVSSMVESPIMPSESHESSSVSTSGNISVTVPVQVVASSTVGSSEMTDVNLTVAVPTPSPSPHNSSQNHLFSVHDDTSQDEFESPKPKSKNKSSRSNHHANNENVYPKPAYSYSCLIAMALKNSKTGSLPVNEIYDFMTENFPYFKTAPNGWKNSVRHNLSLNKCFEKIEKPAGNSTQRKGYLWAMNPAKIEKMEEELQKWGSKDPAAIRKSMANPERLELIEKGELKNSESDSEIENMNISSIDEEENYPQEEKENEMKVQVNSLGNDLLNGDFSSLGESVNIDPCLSELDMQKGFWNDFSDDRLQFLNDSPISPLSPKNSETMDDDSSLDSTPSLQKPYMQANFIYKSAQRASTSSVSSNRFLSNSSLSGKDKGTACNV
ncbi:forkhead box protein N4-like [Argiope bruennichi]|uniref:forkhead box protein N4-like n=1 Tax=Argiope bruennichi TaxID=94029 RepID=UPI002494EDD2|nr:forkhead box protein N4-like [Argiope bruennichi]XP_055931294.1 forkhead box protein N4-like [Argiope bruennichi]